MSQWRTYLSAHRLCIGWNETDGNGRAYVFVLVAGPAPHMMNPTISSRATILMANGNAAVRFSTPHRSASPSNCTIFHWWMLALNRSPSSPYLLAQSDVRYCWNVHCRHSTKTFSTIDRRDCCSSNWPNALYVCPFLALMHLSAVPCIVVQCSGPNRICLADSSYCRIDTDDKSLGHYIGFVRLLENDSKVQR